MIASFRSTASPCDPSSPAGRASSRPAACLLGCLVLLLAVGGCQGGARRARTAAGTGAVAGSDALPTSSQAPSGAAGEVFLSDRDLAPMDAYIRRRFWVLGDDVEVTASMEYFVQYVSITTRIGMVERRDEDTPQGTRTVLRFLGGDAQIDVMTAPRVMVGTGITVTARRTLTVNLVRTRNLEIPVRIRIAANGRASVGQGNEVTRREPSLVVGAQLRRLGAGGYQFEEQ